MLRSSFAIASAAAETFNETADRRLTGRRCVTKVTLPRAEHLLYCCKQLTSNDFYVNTAPGHPPCSSDGGGNENGTPDCGSCCGDAGNDVVDRVGIARRPRRRAIGSQPERSHIDAIAEANGALQEILQSSETPAYVTRDEEGARLWKQTRTFYEKRQFAPAWIENGSPQPQMKALLSAVEAAERDGLGIPGSTMSPHSSSEGRMCPADSCRRRGSSRTKRPRSMRPCRTST